MGGLAETYRDTTQSNGINSARRLCGATIGSTYVDFEGRSLDATSAASCGDWRMTRESVVPWTRWLGHFHTSSTSVYASGAFEAQRCSRNAKTEMMGTLEMKERTSM